MMLDSSDWDEVVRAADKFKLLAMENIDLAVGALCRAFAGEVQTSMYRVLKAALNGAYDRGRAEALATIQGGQLYIVGEDVDVIHAGYDEATANKIAELDPGVRVSHVIVGNNPYDFLPEGHRAYTADVNEDGSEPWVHITEPKLERYCIGYQEFGNEEDLYLSAVIHALDENDALEKLDKLRLDLIHEGKFFYGNGG